MSGHADRAAHVDAIVVTWNSAPHLGAALGSLPATARAIVVDNGSADTSVEVATAAGAEVVALERNVGFPAAVNIGLARVTAPLTLILNPDVVLAPDALERCAEVLLADPTIGIVGANTTDRDGRPEPPAARRDRRAWHVLVESLGLVHIDRRLDRQTVRRRDIDQDVDAVNGAFMLLRTDVLRSLGGLDESVFMFLEDMDLCRRVRDGGLRVRFVTGAGAVHEGGASIARGDPDAQVRTYLHRIDADVEFARRYGRRGEAALAIAAHVLRALVGLAVSLVRPDRRARYRAALPFALAQVRGRRPAPPV